MNLSTSLQTNLILDIRILIASHCQYIWYQFYRRDPEFSQYAKTSVGIQQYRLHFGGPIIDEYNNQVWRIFNKFHRENDLPAIIYHDKIETYYYNGKLHRDADQPAIVYHNRVEYYKHGLNHRDDDPQGNPQPAIIFTDGQLGYYKNGVKQNLLNL